jgi:uncharacterized Zn finger protein
MSIQITLESEITCPKCGHKKTEVMPTDACQWYYECESCHALLKPKTGDCCYFALMAQSHVHRSRKTNLVVLDRDHTLNMGQAITNKPALLAIQSQCPYLFSSNVRCLIYY